MGRDGMGVTDRETTPFSLASLISVWSSGHVNSWKRMTSDVDGRSTKGVRRAWTYFWKCLVSRTWWM